MARNMWISTAVVWLATVCVSVVLVAIHLLSRKKIYWLLPHPGSLRGFVRLAGSLSREAPLLFVALFLLPTLAAVATLFFVLRRN